MKKPRHAERKLAFHKEMIRTLSQLELTGVAGGDPASALCPTHRPLLCPP